MKKLMNLAGWVKRQPAYAAAILFALAIPFSYLCNILFFYIGLCFEANTARSVLFILFNIGFALACGLFFLYSLRRRMFAWGGLIPLGIVLLFFAGSFLASLLLFGRTSDWTGILLQFICIAVPAFLAGACGGAWRAEDQFLPLLERISFFLIPASVIYLVGAVFQCNPYNYGANLGIIGYMNFAYTLMPFLMALWFRFVAGADMKAPLSGKPYRRPQLVRGWMIALFWLSIMATGCRGPIVCSVVFFGLIFLDSCIRRRAIKRTSAISAAAMGVLCISLFVITLPGMGRLSNTMPTFLEGLANGQFTTSSHVDVLTEEELDSLVETPEKPPVQQETPSGTEQTPPATEQEPPEPAQDPEEEVNIGNRGTLFKLAWKEFRNAPITGMGPLGFTEKYDMYPHSALLELLSETGIIGCGLLLALLILAAIRIFFRSSHNLEMLFFLLPYGVAANISGTVWTCAPLLFVLGYGLALKKKEGDT